jgi:hypothetical protein
MSEPGSFFEGKVCFTFDYFDARRELPRIRTYVCLGRNAFGPDTEDYWPFQEGESYAKSGSALGLEQPDYEKIVIVTRAGLGAFIDARTLLNRLPEILGKPDTATAPSPGGVLLSAPPQGAC